MTDNQRNRKDKADATVASRDVSAAKSLCIGKKGNRRKCETQ